MRAGRPTPAHGSEDTRDDLERISGIGPAIARRLESAGISTYGEARGEHPGCALGPAGRDRRNLRRAHRRKRLDRTGTPPRQRSARRERRPRRCCLPLHLPRQPAGRARVRAARDCCACLAWRARAPGRVGVSRDRTSPRSWASSWSRLGPRRRRPSSTTPPRSPPDDSTAPARSPSPGCTARCTPARASPMPARVRHCRRACIGSSRPSAPSRPAMLPPRPRPDRRRSRERSWQSTDASRPDGKRAENAEAAAQLRAGENLLAGGAITETEFAEIQATWRQDGP